MDKMKVLAILPSRVAYGKERANIEVYHLLNNTQRYEVIVLASSKAEHRIFDLLDGLKVENMNFPDRHDHSVPIISYFLSLPIINYSILKIFRKYKPDIIFLNDELSCYDLFWSLMQFKGKIVYRLGDAPAFPGLRFYFVNSRMWQKLCIQKVDTFVCISNYIKKSLEATGRHRKNDRLIYNFPPTRKTIKNKLLLKKDENAICFGYIGQISKHKGVDLFVKAAMNVISNGYNCIFYIAGNTKYDKEFGQTIERTTANESKINLLGEVEDIESFYSGIDVLIVPTVSEEPLSNTIAEAKRYKRPSIIFPSGGMPEMITHKVDGYICKNKTVEALEKGMKYYLDNSDILENHKQAAFDSVLKLGIDRDSFEKKWLEVFGNL